MGNWHRDRGLLKGDYTDTFPLWIHPWVSGIYALDDPERVARPTDRIPALLTAYIDELGDATLMMHVPDYRYMQGNDEIEWCHWTAVRWRRDKSVSLYGRIEPEGWRLEHVRDLRLTNDQHQQLVWSRSEGDWGKDTAIALLPYLPLATRLSIWDGKEPLYCCHDYLDEFCDYAFVTDVLTFEVIPLQETRKWPREFYDTPQRVETYPLTSIKGARDQDFVRYGHEEPREEKKKVRRSSKPKQSTKRRAPKKKTRKRSR